MSELAGEGMLLLVLKWHFHDFNSTSMAPNGTSTELQWHFNGTKKTFLGVADGDNFLMVFYKLYYMWNKDGGSNMWIVNEADAFFLKPFKGKCLAILIYIW